MLKYKLRIAAKQTAYYIDIFYSVTRRRNLQAAVRIWNKKMGYHDWMVGMFYVKNTVL